MKRLTLPSQAYLKECFDYCQDTGHLVWKKRPRHHFSSDQGMKISNGLAGRVAGGPERRDSADSFYWRIRLDHICYRSHVLIWVLVNGDYQFTGNECLDHINGNRADNRIDNLRLSDASANGRNTKLHRHNTSGILGVSYYTAKARWVAKVNCNNKGIYIGSSKDFFEACCLRKSAELKYDYSPTHGRVL